MSLPNDRDSSPAPEDAASRGSVSPPEGEDVEIVPDDGEVDEDERPTLLNVEGAADLPPSARDAESPGAYRVLAELIDKAVTARNVNAVACTVAARLAKLAKDTLDSSPLPRETVDAASRCALKLASATGDDSLLNVVVRVYHARKEAMPIALVDTLYSAVRHTRGMDWSLLGRYVDLLESRRSSMTPAERFATKRITGLMQLGPE